MKSIFLVMYVSAALLINSGGQYTNPISNMNSEVKVSNREPIVKDEKWLYESDRNDKLVKVNADGTNRSYIGQATGSIIDVADGWVYYVDNGIGSPGSRGIYKIKDNQVIKLTSDDYIIDAVFYKDSIYYALGPEMDENHVVKGGLYKVDADGRNKVQLSDQQVDNINIYKDCIYYSGVSSATNHNTISEESSGIFRMNIDGTNKIKISDKYAKFLKLSEDNIYFSDFEDNYKLYKMNIDGKNIKKLNDDISWDIQVSGNWIYYSNNPYDGNTAMIPPLDQTKGNIYKITIDGANRARLNSEASRLGEVLDGWIYYGNWSDKLYKMKLDGSNKLVVN